MIENFNKAMTINEISHAYKSHNNFNTYCFLLVYSKNTTLLKTENNKILLSELREGLQING